MGNGKRIIYFNTGWQPDYIFVAIEEDGGTRKVFYGGIQNTDQLEIILKFVY
jgi:hypothetical protein